MQPIDYHKLATEVRNEMARYHRAVAGGDSVSEAIRFCRFLEWSGIHSLLKQAPDHKFLKVDGALIEWEAKELFNLAMSKPEQMRQGPWSERVVRNLELIAGHISRWAPPGAANVAAQPSGCTTESGGAS